MALFPLRYYQQAVLSQNLEDGKDYFFSCLFCLYLETNKFINNLAFCLV